MNKPTTYHRHEGAKYVDEDGSILCSGQDRHPVAVVDVRKDSPDMQRFFGLVVDAGMPFDNLDKRLLAEVFARFAAGESAGPPPLTEEPTDPAARVVDRDGNEGAKVGEFWVTEGGFQWAWQPYVQERGPLTLKDAGDDE